MPKVTRGMGSSRDPQVARESVVTRPPAAPLGQDLPSRLSLRPQETPTS